ncbi:hypothetical protein CEUSTIGMA_g11591.t1 [Chlamydomonas eustigma]|uniref:Small ribosomal subunit protein uS7 domain-containing protein n=1 Tax=Chlamydomonas eustigma TaxID=1157962 RepID=A0A250XM73_9CHLO|nr:hypothetical protein CEUSTIGMA_g11591.t1 [Chlamydomonas eustigma]|eukprot:GAX84168.1 hypothetical protein CEUSTIGMA_g11591.t1 [Chlamydomonas eustigma]
MRQKHCVSALMQSILKSKPNCYINVVGGTCARVFSQTTVSTAEVPSTSSRPSLHDDDAVTSDATPLPGKLSAHNITSRKHQHADQLAALTSCLKVTLSPESHTEILRYDDSLVVKNLVGCLTKKGKKAIAERIVLDAMEIIRSEMSKAAALEAAEDAARSQKLAEAAAAQAKRKANKKGGAQTTNVT